MTLLDHYLTRYLDGSISEAELAAFGELVDDDPDLRRELAERLELRSVIGDDLLEIEVPEALSQRVRTDVGLNFVMTAESDRVDQLLAEEEEKRRRRGIFLPWQIASRRVGAGLVTFVLLLTVALTPTVNYSSDPDGGSDARSGLFAFSDGTATSRVDAIANNILENNAASGGMLEQTGRTPQSAVRSSTAGGVEAGRTNRVAPVSSSDAAADAVELPDAPVANLVADRTTPIVPAGQDGSDETEGLSSPNLANLDNDLLENSIFENDGTNLVAEDIDPLHHLALQVRRGNTLRPAIDATQNDAPISDARRHLRNTMILQGSSRSDLAERRDGGGDAIDPITSILALPQNNDVSSPLRVRFGGTFASGVNAKATAISLDGSAYLAVGLGEHSRIGLEGGSATFRYRKSVPVEVITTTPVAARQVIQGDLRGGEGRSNGTPDEPPATTGAEVVDGFGGEGANIDPGLIGAEMDPRFSYGSGVTVSYEERQYDTETTMLYGLVFYDHTVVPINNRLAVNGRVGIGGTDGALVANARAYASISTHENISWTVGVGASALHELSGKGELKAGYGLNAGLEFGF